MSRNHELYWPNSIIIGKQRRKVSLKVKRCQYVCRDFEYLVWLGFKNFRIIKLRVVSLIQYTYYEKAFPETVRLLAEISHRMRLWYFSSSVNSFFKRACADIQWARCLIFGGTLRLLPLLMCANSEDSGETARMRRLA